MNILILKVLLLIAAATGVIVVLLVGLASVAHKDAQTLHEIRGGFKHENPRAPQPVLNPDVWKWKDRDRR